MELLLLAWLQLSLFAVDEEKAVRVSYQQIKCMLTFSGICSSSDSSSGFSLSSSSELGERERDARVRR
jgi:hypothetical protein